MLNKVMQREKPFAEEINCKKETSWFRIGNDIFRVSRLLGEDRKVTVTFGKLICIASSHLSDFELRCELI
jgi:hypothetical protein